jgi:hypothetical protein
MHRVVPFDFFVLRCGVEIKKFSINPAVVVRHVELDEPKIGIGIGIEIGTEIETVTDIGVIRIEIIGRIARPACVWLFLWLARLQRQGRVCVEGVQRRRGLPLLLEVFNSILKHSGGGTCATRSIAICNYA